MREILRSGFAELGVPASEEAVAALERYAALLEEKNKVMNLTAIKGAEDVARLHFLDCGALLRYIRPEGKRLLDVGSGAGFPGLVLKFLAPETELTMLDSLQKRVTFLQETAEALGLSGAECLCARAEELPDRRESFDIVTSRAVARLSVLAELCLPLVKTGGVFAAMKGPDVAEELAEAERGISLLGGGKARVERYAIPGTDVTHSVVLIEKRRPTPAKYPRRYAQIKKQPL